jgi:phosphoribosylformimino-5-aminoimidazole carboxamide ribotide isomerase
MIAAPAVDLRGGRCVQLVGGDPADERVSLPDPVAAAERWYALGFGALHVVDLDAALGTGHNASVVERILSATRAETQVGGGIRDDTRADALLAAGADRVVVGTRALDDPAWLARLADRHPGRVVVALDTRGGVVLRGGWTESAGVGLERCLDALAGLPLAGVLSTDVDREGRLGGIDRDACSALTARSPHPVWISGGITTIEELAHLEAAGASGVVLGMALYTQTLDAAEVALRWGGASAGGDARAARRAASGTAAGAAHRAHEDTHTGKVDE